MMTATLLRTLLSERGRLVASVTGVAFSVLLVVFLFGVYNGFDRASTSFIDRAGADVWVTQEGSLDMFHSVSLLPADLAERVAALDGVDAAASLYGRSFHSLHEGHDRDLYVAGFDPAAGLGGPGGVASGRADVGPDDVVVSQVYARDVGAGLGDPVEIAGHRFTITGITDLPSASVYTYAFIHADTARDAFAMGDFVNYVLVDVGPDRDAGTIARAIEQAVPGVSATPAAAFAEQNGRMVRETFLPILSGIAVIGFLIALAVVSITTWSAVTERLSQFGVLKAVGAENRTLYGLVLAQAGAAAVAGFLVGIPLYWATSNIMERLVPRITVATEWGQVGFAGVAVLVMALLAAWLPVRRISAIDPADVFRGST